MTAAIRPPVAPNFYRGDNVAQIEEFLRDFVPDDTIARPIGGVVPHAGWVYSGRTAALVFRNIAEKRTPSTVVLLGAVHRRGVPRPAIYPEGAWRTPLGDAEVDSRLAKALAAATQGLAELSESAHDGEHSVEVLVPMVQYLMPQARILPVAVPLTRDAIPFGDALGTVLRDWPEDVVVVGSTDLTHYGESYGFAPAGVGPEAERWMKANDALVLSRAKELDAEGVLDEAATHYNACGAGAFAASLRAARALGSERGVVIDYTTSHDVAPSGPFTMAVGYAGLLL